MNQMQPGQNQNMKERSQRYSFRHGLSLLRWFFQFTEVPKSSILFISLLSLLISVGNLAAPLLIGRAVDNLFDPGHLLITLGLLGVIYLVTALCGRFQGVAVSRLAQKAGFQIRNALFRTITHLPISFTDTQTQGDIMSRMTNDVEAIVQTLSVVLPGLLSAVITIAGCVLIMLRQSVVITLINLGIGIIMIICGGAYSKFMFGCVHQQQKALANLNAFVTESMTQRRTVYAFHKQKEEDWRMAAASDEMERVGIKAQMIGAVMEPMMSIMGNASFLITAVTGGLLVIDHRITIGMVQACLLYARQLLKPLNELGMLLSQIQGGLACADRIRFLANQPPEEDSGQASFALPNVRGEISFEDITFSYIRGKKVLNHLSLTVFPEETVAIVGETGVGKTTLLNLLLRYYAPDEGQIRIDGTNIQDIPRRKLYRAMAVILQDGSMVTDTIRANISYGNPSASLSEIQDAAAQVHADPFIQRLPEGYQTQVSEERQILSSGERQLICLARIPLMNPRVLILDEATSSVDAHTEQIVQKTLRKIRKGRTCIIIAHRLNTIRDVDRIVVLDHGEIVEDGSHETLMKNKGKYYQLYMSGLSE